ncbi:MAG: cytochrome c class I NirC [Sedimenticola sp.]|jgi:cytochrome c55X|nr:MAG: cytochrome c class I NirC [Sedimenticola sp.]
MHRLLFLPIVGAALSLGPVSSVASPEVPPQRQAELIHLLKHDCGSCHGMRLEGGLGPALKPNRLQNWSPEQLAVTILYGRPGTPMPPWRPFLTDSEAFWLAQQLKQGLQ